MSDLIALYPSIGELFDRTLKNAKVGVIKSREFQRIKEQLIILRIVLDKCDALHDSQREKVVSLIMSDQSDGRERFFKANNFLDSTIVDDSKGNPESSTSWWKSLFGSTDKIKSPAQRMMQQALEAAKKTSDAEFLSQGARLGSLGDSVQAALSDAVKIAQSHFNDVISKTLKKVLDGARHIQRDECMRHIRLEASNQEQKDSANNRSDFLRAIEQQSLLEFQQYERP